MQFGHIEALNLKLKIVKNVIVAFKIVGGAGHVTRDTHQDQT